MIDNDSDSENSAKLIVTRVDQSGNEIANPGDGPAPELIAAADGTFRIEAVPGFYKLEPSHPQYQPVPAAGPSVPTIVELTTGADTDLAPYRFDLRLSNLNVQAVTKLVGGTAVDGAVFDLVQGATSCNGLVSLAGQTSINTDGTTISVAPGRYCLAVNKFETGTGDPGTPAAFPAIVTINVPRSYELPGAAEIVRTATVIAPLPPLRPTLTGKLIAVSGPGMDPVELIVSGAVVTSEFLDATTVDVDDEDGDSERTNLVPAAERGRSATAQPLAAADGGPAGPDGDYPLVYVLDDIPYGENTITAPDLSAAGYTLVDRTADIDVVVSGPQDGPTFTYSLDSADLDIDIGTGDFPSLDARFDDTKVPVFLNTGTDPVQVSPIEIIHDDATSTNILRIKNFSPQAGDYRLSFADVLHEPLVNAAVSIDLTVTDGRRIGTLVDTPTPSLTRWTGEVQQRFGPATSTNNGLGDLDGDAVMVLTRNGGGATYQLAPGGTSSPGTSHDGPDFGFDVIPGTYALEITKDGYFPTIVTGIDLTAAGTVVNRPTTLVVNRAATITLATTSSPGLALPDDLKLELFATGAPGTPLVPKDAAANPNLYEVEAGGDYTARATATGYPTQTRFTTNLQVGGLTLPVPLPRIVRVNVTGSSNATVALLGAAGVAPDTSPPFEFTFAPGSGAAATLRAKVTADGYRTQIVDIPADLVNDPAVPVDLKLDATITGTVQGASGGTVTASAPGMSSTPSATVGSNGSYTLVGLGVGDDGEEKVWTLSYDELGTGTTDGLSPAATVTVTSTNDPTGPTVALRVRPVSYNFDVTPSSGSPKPNVSILNGSGTVIDSDATGGNGDVTLEAPENSNPTTWRVTRPDRLTKSGPLGDLPPSFSKNIDPITLQPAITGTVFDDATTPAAVIDASVVVCPSNSAGPCTPTEVDRSTNSGTGGAFTLTSDLSPGSYRIWASTNAPAQGFVTLTIAGNGAATLSDSGVITIAGP